MNSLNALNIKLLNDTAKPPVRSSKDAVGYDLFSCHECIIDAKNKALIGTGISIQINYNDLKQDETIYGRIAPRSGISYKYMTDIGAGVIDTDYRGELKILMFNHSDETIIFKSGDKIAQLILEKAIIPPVLVVDELDCTERGDGGFGSTGHR